MGGNINGCSADAAARSLFIRLGAKPEEADKLINSDHRFDGKTGFDEKSIEHYASEALKRAQNDGDKITLSNGVVAQPVGNGEGYLVHDSNQHTVYSIPAKPDDGSAPGTVFKYESGGSGQETKIAPPKSCE